MSFGSMISSNASTTVFVETNLETRIAFPVSPDITAKEFKRELEMLHMIHFPRFGCIEVNGVMVKKRSFYYYIPESLPLKYVFQGSEGSWFLRTQVHNLSIMDSCKYHETEIENQNSAAAAAISDSPELLALSQQSSESVTVSVSGIIKKYFSGYDEVDSTSISPSTQVRNRHKGRVNNRSKIKHFNRKKMDSEASKDKRKKPEIGKRLLLASNNLGLTPKEGPSVSLCKFSGKRWTIQKSETMARSLVFEMPDLVTGDVV